MHVHIVSSDGEAKIWLEPNIEICKSYGFTQKQLREITSLTEEHYNELVTAWRKHFNS